MSAENISGEAMATEPPTLTTHIRGNSVMPLNINILNRVNKPCNDPMIPECDESTTPLTPISARVCATNSPAATLDSSHQNQPHPLDMILAGPGADPDTDHELAGLSAQCNNLVTSCTLDPSVISSSNIGPHPSEEVDASAARTAFSGIMGHKNAISDECSSNGGAVRQSDGAGVRVPGADGWPRTTPTNSTQPRVVCETKTVNQSYYDIPCPEPDTQDIAASVTAAMETDDSSFKTTPATYPTVAMTSLSGRNQSRVGARRGGWKLPPGGGLCGGAPLPGETSAISNGTSGWGPPPSASGGGGVSGTSGWGSAPAGNPTSAWGSPQQNININNGEENQTNSKMLNNIPSSSQAMASSSQASQGLVVSSQAPGPPAGAGPGAVQGSTSWAAAAGKGLPPSEGAQSQGTNGTTNKQLEQLNSVREALFSQDGWGCQNVKQDTSWDVGAGAGAAGGPAEPPPAAAAANPAAGQPPKADSMQWTPPAGSGRNDGTDLWRSTLSGVPQPIKPQPTTPWGNHTPAHPADYKTWGEPDGDGPSEPSGPSQPDNSGNMWNVGGGGPGSGPGSSGSGGGPPPGAWDHDRNNDRAQFDADRDRSNWGGAPKPKEEPMGWNNSGNQWGPTGGNPSNGSGGWGPPPAKPGQGGGAGGGWGNSGPAPGPAPGPRAPQWGGAGGGVDNDSPTMARRFDDGGTSIWGGKSQSAMPGGPPGGWKDMPAPNIGSRGPPGPNRMPPGPGAGPVKPSENSPWGQPHPARGWDENNVSSGAGGWGGMGMGMEDKPRSGGDMWNTDKNWNGGNRVQQMPGMRSSPSWDEPPGMMGDRAGGWGSGAGARPNISKDIWNSKQFRILCEMGFKREDVETALRNSNMQLDDALEMLNALRGGMPGGGRAMPPNDVFGPRGEPDYGMRFPGPGPMPYPPGSDMPGAAGGGNMNPSRPGNLNPGVMNGGGGGPGGPNLGHPGAGPPRPQPSGPPSTAQLRVLVQQIQMAVQAGHLNPQILNQPLAPQTLYLLNQLLQQIKQLQTYQQQHAMAQAQAGQRPGANQQQAILGLTVQITKHKQQIQNLQNQITAQQAKYLANQHAQPMPGGPSGDTDLSLPMGGMNISENGSGAAPGGSKLLQMINKDNEFSRAPGSAKNSASSPNLLLDNGPWSNGQGGTGWPDSNNDNKPVNTSNSTDDDNFGIPEFVPGKAWKGTAQMKDPTEDPTMTPGSVASGSSNLIAPVGSVSEKTVTPSSDPGQLSSSTWSLTTPASSKESSQSVSKDSWGLATSSSSNTLTEMGQNLWGVSRSQSSKQQTPTTSLSTWPSSNGLNTTGGWSNGSTTTTSSYLGSIGQSGSASAWLLLKNLTAQIDGSTLRTLCMQHGPLNNFHLYLTHGIALVKYSNGLEAKKAQNALNNCVLGNTTILAATAEEQEVESIIRQLSQHSGAGGYNSSIGKPQHQPGQQQQQQQPSQVSSSSGGQVDTWSVSSLGWPSSSLGGGSVWGAPDSDQHNRTTPLNSFLPPDLLSEGGM